MMDDYKELLQKRVDDIFKYQNGTQDDLMVRLFIEYLYRQVVMNDYDCKHLYKWELGKEVIESLGSNIVQPDKATPKTLFDIPILINNHATRVIRLWRLMNYEG